MGPQALKIPKKDPDRLPAGDDRLPSDSPYANVCPLRALKCNNTDICNFINSRGHENALPNAGVYVLPHDASRASWFFSLSRVCRWRRTTNLNVSTYYFTDIKSNSQDSNASFQLMPQRQPSNLKRAHMPKLQSGPVSTTSLLHQSP